MVFPDVVVVAAAAVEGASVDARGPKRPATIAGGAAILK